MGIDLTQVTSTCSLPGYGWLGYLDEFTFRFNRRTSRHRGKLFYRLVQHAVAVAPAPYKSLVGGKHKILGSP